MKNRTIIGISILATSYAFGVEIPENCPKGLEEWNTITKSIETEFTKKPQSIAEYVPYLNKCVSKAPKSDQEHLDRCMGNIQSYATREAQRKSTTHRMGLKTPDQMYRDLVTDGLTNVPSDIAKDDKLLYLINNATLDNPKSVDAAVARINELYKNVDESLKPIVVPYKGHMIPSAEDTTDANYGRIMVYIPGQGKEPNRYINFSISETAKDKAKNHRGATSVIAVSNDQPPKVYFEDRWRKIIKKPGMISYGKVDIVHSETNAANNNCMDCHFSGPLAIHPAKNFFDDPNYSKYSANLDAMNRVIKSQSKARTPFFDYRSGGPHRGEIDPPSRTDAFMKKCTFLTGDTPEEVEARNKIKKAMNCAACHNDRGQSPSDRGALRHNPTKKITEYIAHGYMPPGSGQWSIEERTRLNACLTQEGRIQLKEWLFGQDCLPNIKEVIETISHHPPHEIDPRSQSERQDSQKSGTTTSQDPEVGTSLKSDTAN